MDEKPKRILVVEDETIALELIVIRLEKEGFEVFTASDGEEGLRAAREEPPDLIILDLMLPKLDGFKVCRMLKFDNRFKHIPVIMLTAMAEEKDAELGSSVGADEYLTKPFEWDVLKKAILKLLKIKNTGH